MKNLLLIPGLFLCCGSFAQMSKNSVGSTITSSAFLDYQRTQPRPSDALNRNEDTIQKQFEAKGLKWPAKYVYIRSFKYDSQFEIWVKNEKKEPYKLFKSYKICALAGTLGPKRMEGDYQVPEGFYYINEFNPRSNYHLSLGLNYPNASDRILSDSLQPGGDIYIHGSCVTIGCIPLTDPMIEEVYIITAHAKDQGQDFIPVHIFPVKFNVKRSVDIYSNMIKDDEMMKRFASNLEDAFNYFEKFKQVPVVMVSENGEYIVNNPPPKKGGKEEVVARPKKTAVTHRVRNVIDLPVAVHQWPKFPGGADEFMKYLDEVGKELSSELPAGVNKAHIQVEFVIDWDGVPVNFKILKGVDEYFNDEVITRLEKSMKNWEPALLNDKPVPKKMVQTITIATPEGKQ